MVVTMRVLLAIESVTFVDESLLSSVKLRPVWEFHTPICGESNNHLAAPIGQEADEVSLGWSREEMQRVEPQEGSTRRQIFDGRPNR